MYEASRLENKALTAFDDFFYIHNFLSLKFSRTTASFRGQNNSDELIINVRMILNNSEWIMLTPERGGRPRKFVRKKIVNMKKIIESSQGFILTSH